MKDTAHMTKLVVRIGIDLKTLKRAYRKYYGISANEKVLKSDIARWAASLAEADIEDNL